MKRIALASILLLAAVTSASAQTQAERLARQARGLIDDLKGDSAYVLLSASLRQATTQPERIRGFTLLGFAQLLRNDRPAARQAFEQLLRLDPNARIDSLADLHTEAQLVFDQARTIVRAAPVRDAFAYTVEIPIDTVVSSSDPRLPFVIQPNARATIITSITSALEPSRPIWSDTQSTAGRRTITWTMRRAGVELLPGRYVLRIQATDSSGAVAPATVRQVRIERVSVDTQPFPQPLTAASFASESLPSRPHRGRGLMTGGALAAIIVGLPSVLGNSTLNSDAAGDATAYVVAGGVAVASITTFITGKRPQPNRANIQANTALREKDRLARQSITSSNAQLRAQAPWRIIVERSP